MYSFSCFTTAASRGCQRFLMLSAQGVERSTLGYEAIWGPLSDLGTLIVRGCRRTPESFVRQFAKSGPPAKVSLLVRIAVSGSILVRGVQSCACNKHDRGVYAAPATLKALTAGGG